MKNQFCIRTLGFLMALVIVLSMPVVSVFADELMQTNDEESEAPVSEYSVFLTALEQLEQYADIYVREHADEESVALVINFIRTGVDKYNSGTWNTFCGEENTAFTSFVAEQDALYGTNASCLRNLGTFTIPNGNSVEFDHMFGCMDMAYHTGNQSTADLGSWAGDICDLLQLSHNYGVSGTVDEMVAEISTNDRLFLYDDPSSHSFGQRDLYGDLDAFYILQRINSGNTISQIMKSYFTANLNDSFRAAFFIDNRLGGVKTRTDIRNAVFEIYYANEGIRTLEGTYITDGINPDLRKACCYVFADYLYNTALDRLENPYYTTFSSQGSLIAPGVTQEIKMAMTQDNKQIVYYIATADISRDDVQVYANYGYNDATTWRMTRVSEQIAAAQAKHSDPNDTDNYIPNYNAVVGINADFYNMSTGVPSGALVMNGVEYHPCWSNFFAILNDGTPVLADKSQWNTYKDQVVEAVGTSVWLVKDGKIVVNASSNYYNERASRTAVGITYDGRVVFMVLDGRQEPFSAGGSYIEIAQIMLDAGCIAAMNLDGGGSSTYVAKQEGFDTPVVVNRPSDGYERSVSSSLMVVSTAKPSNVFDHAVISADYDYLSVGSSLEITASGVTATGGAIAMPEGTTLQVSDPSIGYISGNTFTANALGDIQVCAISENGDVLGSKTLHVVEPTNVSFTKTSINAIYGVAEELPLEATYNGKPAKINPNDVIFGFLKITLQSIGNLEGGAINTTRTELVFDYPEAGVINGFTFTGNAEGNLRTLTIGAIQTSKFEEIQEIINEAFMAAYLQALEDGYPQDQAQLIAEEAAVKQGIEYATKVTVYLYNQDEATFDFSEATGGDGLLYWKRNVTNSNYDDEQNTYYVKNVSDPSVVSYTFAVDMSKMPIPQKLTGLLFMLPGGDQEGRTAWDFLLQLAERISPLTTVTVTIEIPEGFEADISGLQIVNEYFDLTSAEIDGRIITIIGNFKMQTEPINPTTANPICVVSGLKLTPTDSAAWSDDNSLNVELTGIMSYDIYAHFHVLKSLASQEEFQELYGLYPYDNSENINDDYGAHFSNASDDPEEFHDSFIICAYSKQGWVYQNIINFFEL